MIVSSFMSRNRTVALFLTSLALAGGTVACSHTPAPGDHGGDNVKPSLSKPSADSAPSNEGGEGGEGGEG